MGLTGGRVTDPALGNGVVPIQTATGLRRLYAGY